VVLIVQAGLHGPPPHLPAVVRSRSVYALFAGLALVPLVSGCGGASPETRATETVVTRDGTLPPTQLEAARTAVALGTFTGIDRESALSLTAEATLHIATPEPGTIATHLARKATR
jgi:hypothetical protein